MIVAIDGPSGAGKSTLAKALAARLGFLYIDTGAMYRAVALWASRLGAGMDDQAGLTRLAQDAVIELKQDGSVLLNGEDISSAIRTPEMGMAASTASKISGVRAALVAKQREMGARHSVVMEGRDIGTVVFPEAEAKIYLTASLDVRARRRLRDHQDRGEQVDFEALKDKMGLRDKQDMERDDSPLRQADDAIVLDSSLLDPRQTEDALLRIVEERMGCRKELQR